MGNPALGFYTALGIGEEIDYGTPGERNKWVEIDSEALKVEERMVRAPSVYGVGHRSTRVRQGAVAVAGDIVFSPQFEGWYKILKHALGQVVTTSPDPTNAPSVRKHTFSPGDFLPTALSFELQKDYSTIPNAVFVATGAKINTLAMQVSAESQLQVTCGIVAKQMLDSIPPSTPSFSSTKLIPGTIGALTWGGGSLDVGEMTINIENNLATDRRFLGSRFIKEPVRMDKFVVSGTFRTEFQSMSEYNDFRNDTRRSLVIDFVGDAISGTSYNYELKLTLPVTRIAEYNPNVNNPGMIPVEVSFESYRDDSNEEITIEATNEEATI